VRPKASGQVAGALLADDAAGSQVAVGRSTIKPTCRGE
jgi:hypothetical protein